MKHTLGRLTQRSEFLFIREGRYKAQGGVVVQVRENPKALDNQSIRVGFTATKRIGNAVKRNRAKRRLRETARKHLPRLGLPGHDYVFIARDGTNDRPFALLLDDVEKALISLSAKHR